MNLNTLSYEVRAEVERLAGLPQQGSYTLLHHSGPVVESSDDLMERVEYIVDHKAAEEVLLRLRNIHYLTPDQVAEYQRVEQPALAEYWLVRQSAWAEYWRVKQSAWAEYRRVEQSARAEYQRVVTEWLTRTVPFTSWNGHSIFE